MQVYPDSPRHPKQRYYLSEKGLKLAEKEFEKNIFCAVEEMGDV